MVGKVLIERDAIELRGRLVLLAPGLSTVEGDIGAAIIGVDHPQRIVRRNPEVVVVAVGDLDGRVGPSTIDRFVEGDIENIDGVGADRVGVDVRVVPGTLTQIPALIDAGPRRSGIVGTKDAAVVRFDEGPDPVGIGRRNGDPDLAEKTLRQPGPAGDVGPGIAAIRRLVEAAIRAAALQAVRGPLDMPERGVEYVGIGRIEDEVDRAGLITLVENPLPGLAAIARSIDAPLFVGPKDMAQGRDVDQIGIARVDTHSANVAGVLQPHPSPGPPGVSRAVDAVPVRTRLQVRPASPER